MSLINSLKEKVFSLYLNYHCSPGQIKHYLRTKKLAPMANCGSIDLSQLKVAAVQLELKLTATPLEYVDQMLQKVQEAALAGAQLVVFPEDNTLQLLGLLPGVKDLQQGSADQSLQSLGSEISLEDIFSFLSPFAYTVYQTTFSELAKTFNIFIMGGSMLLKEQEKPLVNRAFLFDPKGRVVGHQDKAHLLPLEHSWGISCGQKLSVYPTEIGNVAFPICMDATYFETFRLLALEGADLVMLPIANPEEYNYWKALRGIWPRVQESYVYGIKSTLVCSNFFGFTFTGQAGIYAPLELTPKGDGVLAEIPSWDKEGMVLADLNILALRQARTEAQYFGNWNKKLYERYFPAIYQNFDNKGRPKEQKINTKK